MQNYIDYKKFQCFLLNRKRYLVLSIIIGFIVGLILLDTNKNQFEYSSKISFNTNEEIIDFPKIGNDYYVSPLSIDMNSVYTSIINKLRKKNNLKNFLDKSSKPDDTVKEILQTFEANLTRGNIEGFDEVNFNATFLLSKKIEDNLLIEYFNWVLESVKKEIYDVIDLYIKSADHYNMNKINSRERFIDMRLNDVLERRMTFLKKHLNLAHQLNIYENIYKPSEVGQNYFLLGKDFIKREIKFLSDDPKFYPIDNSIISLQNQLKLETNNYNDAREFFLQFSEKFKTSLRDKFDKKITIHKIKQRNQLAKFSTPILSSILFFALTISYLFFHFMTIQKKASDKK